MFRATILTLFPAMFPGPLGQSLAGEALARGLWSLEPRDLREHGPGRHRAGDDESFEQGLLEYPHYTRPREWKGRTIPEVLLSGDRARIAECRRAEAERITQERRPDLSGVLPRGKSGIRTG